MRAALAVEALKLSRSPAARVATAVLVLVIPLVSSAMVAVASGDSQAPMAVKVRPMLIGTGWTAHLTMLAQMQSIAVLLAVGIVVSWVVGRELADRTVGALLALPTRPGAIVLAKLVVIGGWAVGCGGAAVLVGLASGWAAGLGAPGGQALAAAGKVLAVMVLGTLLCAPLAWLSTVLRGYLAGVTGVIVILIVTNVVTASGAGAWFPYAAPSLWAGMGGAEAAAAVTPWQLSLTVPVGVLGAWAAARAWQRGDLV
ncbi:MAG TPA: ABC transporter permease [Actinotalea sp.]|nr:ABC transporter permease [Actinotalea sp.]